MQKRLANGEYSIASKVYRTGDLIATVEETGRWWVDGELFYERCSDRMKQPDVYSFEFLSEDEIRFTAVSADRSGDVFAGYIFVDKRMK